VTFDDLMPYILPQAKGCPAEVDIFNARLAAIELCQQALIWREYQPEILTVADQTSYLFTPAADQQICKLLSLTLSGSPVAVVDPAKGAVLDAGDTQWTYAYAGLRSFELRPAQVADLPIITYCAVAPSIAAETIPDDFMRYAEQLARGALSRLLMNAGRDYGDPRLAFDYRRQWEDDIGDARSDAFRGFARTNPRVVASWM
jgi:hypothetical protein